MVPESPNRRRLISSQIASLAEPISLTVEPHVLPAAAGYWDQHNALGDSNVYFNLIPGERFDQNSYFGRFVTIDNDFRTQEFFFLRGDSRGQINSL